MYDKNEMIDDKNEFDPPAGLQVCSSSIFDSINRGVMSTIIKHNEVSPIETLLYKLSQENLCGQMHTATFRRQFNIEIIY